MGQLSILFLRNKHTHTHTQGRGKIVLTQRHTTTPLKNHDNFLREGGALIIWLDSIRATTIIKCVTSSDDPSNHLTFEFV